MPYQAQIKRGQPALLVLLLDQSSSMSDPCAGAGKRDTKASFLADAINRALFELVTRSTKEDEVRQYFDVAILGYGGRSPRVTSAFAGELQGRDMVGLSELAFKPVKVETRSKKEPDGAGGIVEVEIQFPVWISPIADGYTPMSAALREARQIVERWLPEHRSSFPPVVLNITDGEATDGDPSDDATALRALATDDGNLLLLNCHLSATQAAPVSFPVGTSDVPNDEFAQRLFAMSSVLPESTLRRAGEEGHQLQPGARGFVFNADAAELFKFIDIGTKPTNEMR